MTRSYKKGVFFFQTLYSSSITVSSSSWASAMVDLEAEVRIRTGLDRDCPEAYRFLRYGILSLADRKGCTFSERCYSRS